MKFGTTFSPLQCEYFGLDYKECFEHILTDTELSILRLGIYWNRVEKSRGSFNFEEVLWLLEQCRINKKIVILTVGMKAPRWPEFYVPDFYNDLDDDALKVVLFAFIRQSIVAVEDYFDVIEYLQVENEPLHAFDINGNRRITQVLLVAEINLIRALIPVSVSLVMTCGLSITRMFDWQDIKSVIFASRHFDYVGFNVYVNIGVENGRYLVARNWLYLILRIYVWYLRLCGKKCFIAEMQDEPWEHGSHVHLDNNCYESWSEVQTGRVKASLVRIPFSFILIWGNEWRYYTKKAGLLLLSFITVYSTLVIS